MPNHPAIAPGRVAVITGGAGGIGLRGVVEQVRPVGRRGAVPTQAGVDLEVYAGGPAGAAGAVDDRGERTLGEYTFNHTARHPQR